MSLISEFFNNAFNNSDFIASNDWMTAVDEMEKRRRDHGLL
jgi:hypothetical protein